MLVCDLTTAAREHPELLARAFGATSAVSTKFGALAGAFAQLGAFVYVPAECASTEPVEIAYEAPAGASIFPYTVVLAERGSAATIVERCEGADGAFVCGVAEIVTEAGADIVYASCQQLAPTGRALFTRAARPGRDASVSWHCAELGAALAVADLSIAVENPGATAGVTAVFFPNHSQHVDVVSTVNHAVGDSTSETIVKSAGVDSGQARYLGNIRIAPGAQGSDASLRDDALLLSEKAHVDSVPALEIGANEVKAFHGATVGAIDAEQIFYMQHARHRTRRRRTDDRAGLFRTGHSAFSRPRRCANGFASRWRPNYRDAGTAGARCRRQAFRNRCGLSDSRSADLAGQTFGLPRFRGDFAKAAGRHRRAGRLLRSATTLTSTAESMRSPNARPPSTKPLA